MRPAETTADREVPRAGGSICNMTALRKATRRLSLLYDSLLAPCGLRSTQRSILVTVAKLGTPTMSELAGALVLDRSALAHNLKPLEREGLVTVVANERDRRSRLIELTVRGENKIRESETAWLQAQQRFEHSFGSQESAALRRSLASIAAMTF